MSPRPSATLLAQMMALHPTEIDLSLDRTWRLLEALGNPQNALPPVVHVAGTNGKGSTLAMIRAGLTAAGRRVHAYTSPHLVRFHERIVLAGEEITEQRLSNTLRDVLEANAGRPITFFEATTAAAFLAFSRVPADALLLEVGLGGRMDSTNVIDAPALTVITPVDLDHREFLGEDIATIAGEKAGILKRGVPVVVARQADPALEVIESRAARLGAPVLAQGQHWQVGTEAGRLVFQDETGLLDLPLPALAGAHQIDNAGTALAALRALGIGADACAGAMTGARWPARMQRLRGRLAAAHPGLELWLDGGHNAHAARALATTLADLAPRPTHLICAMLSNRDPAEFLAPFAGQVLSVSAVPIPSEPKSHLPETIATAAATLGLPAATACNVFEALETLNGTPARVLICGSLYLAGAVLRAEEG